MQKTNYRIDFVSGELAGRSFVLPFEGLLIGKSRSAAIRPGGREIGIEHARLYFQVDGTPVLKSLAETVFVREKQLEPGEECVLEPGIDIRLGNDLSFVVKIDDSGVGSVVPLPDDPAQDEETLDSDTGTEDSSAEDEKSGKHTRYASAVELNDLRTFAQRKVRKRKVLLSVSVLLFLMIVIGGFICSEFYLENPLTWPGELNNQFNDGEFRIEVPRNGKFLIYFPKCKYTRIMPGENKTDCDVMTLLGKNLDVPFHLSLKVNKLPNGFIVSRKKSFALWRKSAEESGFSFLAEPEQKFFAPQDSCGYPYYFVGYRRTEKNFRWQGFACYLRYYNYEIIFLREVPVRHFWRAESVLERYNCFVVSPLAVSYYWEIPEKVRLDCSSNILYKGLLENMWGNLISCNWQDMKENFAQLLSLSHHQKDASMAKDSAILWREFRERQQHIYSQACLAYQRFEMLQDQDGMLRIRSECLRKFPLPDDCRHERIMKNIWNINL
ncbi:MAG: FHA domain-containing protein [Lentisphaeria bacterium]|nr:FHA domain-containing protein [Lentisphaeria bacterium]